LPLLAVQRFEGQPASMDDSRHPAAEVPAAAADWT